MYGESYVSVLIAAAGQGKRMGGSINKQFIKLMGKPILAHTIEAFLKSKYIDEIITIVHEDEVELCKKEVLGQFFPNKEIKIAIGGKERQESVYNGLKKIEDKGKNHVVLIHDGARPFINVELINSSIDEVIKNKAVGVGVPVKDTIKVVEGDYIKNTPPRNTLWSIQTPQSFCKELILEAHRRAVEENYFGTDDCMLVERLGHPIKMIMGSYSNIKITTPEDLILGETILKKGF